MKHKSQMKNNLKSAVVISAKIGAGIIENGGEIERAEDSAKRICRACGVENASVFALNSVIFVSGSNRDFYFTHSIRIRAIKPHMAELERINDLSRRICSGSTNLKSADYELENTALGTSAPKVLLGEIITAVSFTLFYSGSFKDILCAIGFAIILHFEKICIAKAKISPYIGYAAITFVPSFAIHIAESLQMCDTPFAVIAGCLISMFPGITLVNATLSLLSSNTISAILQMISSILITISIASGFILSSVVWGAL